MTNGRPQARLPFHVMPCRRALRVARKGRLAVALATAFASAQCAADPASREGGRRPDDLAGSDACATCHEEEGRLWRYGAHRSVECERCHGPGAKHAGAESGSRPELRAGGIDLCLSCHGDGAASTIGSLEDHLKEIERQHRIKLDRRKAGADCVYCHDPHLLE